MWIFKKPPPPPLPIYKRKPIATAAVILTMIGMFVLGPVGAIYKGLTEDLKEKANNETLLLYMQQQKETDDRQWKAIENTLEPPQEFKIGITEKFITKEIYDFYESLPNDKKEDFRNLHPVYQTLPPPE